MTNADSGQDVQRLPTAAPLPDSLPTEGTQIAIAWVVFGSLVVCVLGILAIVAMLMP